MIRNIELPNPKISLRVRNTAKKIEQNILTRGYKPGDMYLPARELSKLIGESEMTVQRAMAYLASRNVLKRVPKTGTFIGDSIQPKPEHLSIHFFMPDECLGEAELQRASWEHIAGIKTVLPQISVSFDFVPHQNLAYVQSVIEQSHNAIAGVTLILSSRQIRSFFNESGIPTVVLGSAEPDLSNLCWIDLDQVQVGRLLASHLIKQGHRRIATIMRETWSRGEHGLHDGIGEIMAEHGLPANALIIRSAPIETDAITELSRTILEDSDPPSGIICRTEFQADCVWRVVCEYGMSDSVEVVVCNASTENSKYTHASPQIGAVEMGRVVGDMFRNMMNNQEVAQRGHVVPVHLCCQK